MNQRMSLEDFEENILGQDIATKVNNILVDMSGYSGIAIHSLPEQQLTLGHIRNWIDKGWLRDTRTFGDLKSANPSLYGKLLADLYKGFEKGLYKI